LKHNDRNPPAKTNSAGKTYMETKSKYPSHIWISPAYPENHLEDQGARSAFECPLCHETVWKERPEINNGSHWLWCACATARFDPDGEPPENAGAWGSLVADFQEQRRENMRHNEWGWTEEGELPF
jgi:hypothetical protein